MNTERYLAFEINSMSKKLASGDFSFKSDVINTFDEITKAGKEILDNYVRIKDVLKNDRLTRSEIDQLNHFCDSIINMWDVKDWNETLSAMDTIIKGIKTLFDTESVLGHSTIVEISKGYGHGVSRSLYYLDPLSYGPLLNSIFKLIDQSHGNSSIKLKETDFLNNLLSSFQELGSLGEMYAPYQLFVGEDRMMEYFHPHHLQKEILNLILENGAIYLAIELLEKVQLSKKGLKTFVKGKKPDKDDFKIRNRLSILKKETIDIFEFFAEIEKFIEGPQDSSALQ
jgi:hypothetical protein